MMIKSIDFLEKQGRFYENIYKYVLIKEDALEYIQLLFHEKKVILGGDVLYYDEEEGFYSSFDNWYLQGNDLNVEQSYLYTKSYITSYVNKKLVYFDIVV